MPKLTDTQLVILSAAAKRQDRAVLPLPRSLKVHKAAATTVLKSLLKKSLVAERPAATSKQSPSTKPPPKQRRRRGTALSFPSHGA